MLALKLALIGDPVAHSRSPALQRGFLAAAGVCGSYEAIRVSGGAGARTIEVLRDDGYTGLNVTTPLKEEAFARADLHDAAAHATGAVNTLLLGERIAGYNTDGAGAVGALREAGLADVSRARVLVLGAGPTARATIAALVAAGASVYVWNRTATKAQAVVRDLGARMWAAGLVPDAVLATLAPEANFDDAALVLSILNAAIVVDANYGARSTLGAVLGRAVFDGTSMLEGSARASFELFRTVQ